VGSEPVGYRESRVLLGVIALEVVEYGDRRVELRKIDVTRADKR
jgi:hypothetical protein